MLPAAVRARATAANELMAKAVAARAAGATATPSPTPTPTLAAAATDVTALQKQLEEANAQIRTITAQLTSLRGKYDAEVPRLSSELRKKEEDLKKAKELAEASAKSAMEKLEITSLSVDERKLAGEDMVMVTAKVAREIATAAVAQALAPFNERINLLDRMSEDAFLILIDEIPSFDAQNNDTRFLAWLQQTDPRTGRLRFDLVRRAEAARQGHMVAEIFAAFREGREIGVPKAAPPPEPPLDPGDGNNTVVDLAKDANGKRIWKRAEIHAFYDEKRRGLWRDKAAEARKIEEDISAASVEGRIRDR